MLKAKLYRARDFVLRNYKIFFPAVLVVVVALTVLIALNINHNRMEGDSGPQVVSSEELQEEQKELIPEQVPLVRNENSEIETLISSYYKAKGEGDTETMVALSDTISETDLLYYEELSKYIDAYDGLEIFTKQGLLEDSVVAYVYLRMEIKDYCGVPGYEAHYLCRNEAGSYYIKNQGNCSPEEKEFIKKLNEQVDVVEFNNRVNVEYDELMAENPELLEYLGILGEQVQIAVGEVLAAQNVEETAPEEVTEVTDDTQTGSVEENMPQETEAPQTVFAKVTTTVNVRSSDSEKADKLGKLTGGSKVQVQEVRVNGWTKILYENKDGYVKSEFLAMEESANGYTSVGTVVANTNINVRSAASESADRLGVLTGGESAELIAVEGDWFKIKYNGQVGYVKSEYATRQ